MPTNKKEYNKKYYQEHKEQHASYQKKYYEAHKKELYEKYKDRHAEWQRKNKDKLKVIKARYRKKLALHKKRVKQAKFQCRDSKGRFCNNIHNTTQQAPPPTHCSHIHEHSTLKN